MDLRPALSFAWYGSGRRYDGLPMQLLGGVVGGLGTFAAGLKMPQAVLDNPSLSAVVATIIGSFAGVIAIFCFRLAYWPIYRRAQPYGGLLSFIQLKIGRIMWPAVLMISGVILFVVLFGGGAIWFVIDREKPTAVVMAAPPAPPLVAVAPPAKKADLSFEDRQFRLEARKFILSDCLNLHQSFFEATAVYFAEGSSNQQHYAVHSLMAPMSMPAI